MTTAQKEAALAADQAKLATVQARARTRKPAASKPAPKKGRTQPAPKPAPKKAAPKKPAGPSARDQHRAVAGMIMKMAADLVERCPAGGRSVNGTQVSRDQFVASVKQCVGYLPADLWDPRLGHRDVGRPAPVKKSAA